VAAAFAAAGCRDAPVPPGEVTPEVSAILSHLPGDAWAVIGINAARARAVPALSRLLEWLPPAPLAAEIVDGCGLDARRRIDLAVATLGRAASPEAVFVGATGTFSRDSVATCLADLARTGQPIATAQEGAVTAYGARGDKGHIYWPTAEVAVMSPRAQGAAAALGEIANQGGVMRNEALMSYVSRARTNSALWMAGPLPPAMQERLAGFGPGVPALRGFFMSADGDESGAVRVLLGLRVAGEKQAKAAAEAFRSQRAALAAQLPGDARAAAIAKRIEVARSGSDVVLQVTLTAPEVDMLVQLIAGLTRPTPPEP